MTLEDAIRLSGELRERFRSPYSAEDKQRIRMLYREVLGKTMKQTNCQSCFHDAVIEICCFLRRNNTMAKKGRYSMRAGFVLSCPSFDGGKIYTNSNLTDEVAERYIKSFPEQAKFFVIDESVAVEQPEVEEQPEEVESVPEVEEPEEQEVAEQPEVAEPKEEKKSKKKNKR